MANALRFVVVALVAAFCASASSAQTEPDGQYFQAGPFFEVPGAEAAEWPILVDLDDDGDLDAVMPQVLTPQGGPARSGQVLAMLNDGSGAFSPAPASFMKGISILDARDWAVADLDGDGRDDVVLASHGTDGRVQPEPGEQSRILLRRKAGGLRDMTKKRKFPKERGYVHSMAAGDIDGDGDVDVYFGHIGVCDTCFDRGQFYINQRKARFKRTTENVPWEDVIDFLGSNLAFWSVTLFDADFDGDLDLLAGPGDFPGQHIYKRDLLLLNDGSGEFELAKTKKYPKRPKVLDGNGWVGTPFTHADVNCDGRSDAILGYDTIERLPEGSDGIVRIWIQKKRKLKDLTKKMLGDLQFHTNAWIFPADFNGDGWVDLFVPGAHGVQLLINDRGRRFLDGRHLHPVFEQDIQAAVGDLDGDGDVDVLQLEGHRRLRMLENVQPYMPAALQCEPLQ